LFLQKGAHILDIKQRVGARIKALRMKKGLTQEELSELVGINPKYLSGIERGRENPTFNTFISLAKSLEVDLGEVFVMLEAEDSEQNKEYAHDLLDNASGEQSKVIYKVIRAVLG
jgi:transcriptional regulator with XRE-family HTH domain